MAYWLVKSEPNTWSWDDHVKAGVTQWDGVRNYQARNHMKAMQLGDLVLMYHSGKERSVVGLLQVVKEYYPDPTDPTDRFGMVDLKALQPVNQPVTLAQIKAQPALADIALVRHSRLSVMPLDTKPWNLICKMAGIETNR